VRRITNDVNEYDGVSLTADGSILAAGMDEGAFNLWIVGVDGSPPRQITTGTKGTNGVSDWTGDGTLLCTSDADGTVQIWTMAEDGANRVRLTGDDLNADPRLTPDGRRIVFNSTRGGGIHVWSMDRDGANPTQITHGTFEVNPRISPDGQWIVYMGGTGQNIHKVPLAGGDPVQLTTTISQSPRISPDGRTIAYRAFDPEAGKQRTFVIPFDGGEPVAVLDIPSGNHEWTPDGKGIAYVDDEGGVENIWVHLLEGGTRQKLTGFTEDSINEFAWSPDGKRIAVSRGRRTSDVVLLKNFR
jgi:Tol biopolymer transport system component